MQKIKFWCLVHEKAKQDTFNVLLLSMENIVIGTGVVLIYLFLVWNGLGSDAGWGEIKLRLTWTLALLLAIPIVYICKFITAPGKLYRESEANASALKNELADFKNTRAILQTGNPQVHQSPAATSFNWRISITNNGLSAADNVQIGLYGINPFPPDSYWEPHYPYPLTRTGLTLDSPITPINPGDAQNFDLFFSFLDSSGKRFVLLDTVSNGQNTTPINEGEKLELTYKVTAKNCDAIEFALTLRIHEDKLIVERKN